MYLRGFMNEFIDFYGLYKIIKSARNIKLNGNPVVYDPNTHPDEIALEAVDQGFSILDHDSIFIVRAGLIIISSSHNCDEYYLPWVIQYESVY